MTKAAIWLRVSDAKDQTTDNQRMVLEQLATSRNMEIVKVYDVGGSAFAGDHLPALKDLLARARLKQFDVVLIWALDRLDRGGIRSILNIVTKLDSANIRLISVQEGWVESAGPLRDLLIAVMGWAANYESRRKSERIRAGLARRKAQGLPVGRQPGSKDLPETVRRRGGYVVAAENREELRRAQNKLESSNGAGSR